MVLAILIAVLLFGSLRIAGTIASWPLLVATLGTTWVIYLILSGGLLVAGGSWMLWMWYKQPPGAVHRMAWMALLGGVWYWLERFWLGNLQGNLPFAIASTLFIEAVFWFPILLNSHHPAKGESHERESEN